MTIEHPVVIAGSGPSGSVLALYLAQRDIPVVLLEKCDSIPIDLRASTFHPPSLEMIEGLGDGILDEMLAKGLKVSKYQYRDRRTDEVAEFDMAMIADETRFPFRLQLEQYELTLIIEQKLKNYPCAQQRFNCELIDFTQSGDHVDAVIKNHATGEQETLRASFLVGAEGARSVVRKKAGIEYAGFTYQEKFLVASTSFPFEEVFDNLSWVNYVADPEEWCVILRTDKKWRVLFPTDPEQTDDSVFLTDEFIQARLHHLYDKEGDYEIDHRTLYDVHQRVAETYYKGRVVLVGDACHINNPLGGMGMNGGLHDAFNLAEKMVEIVKQDADHGDKFAHYDRQRRELAVKFVQEHTIQNKALMESTDEEVQNKRQKMLMETAADPDKARAFLLERAMINCVRDSLAVA